MTWLNWENRETYVFYKEKSFVELAPVFVRYDEEYENIF
jgi:hypothetical protein